jgi:hypothetical protein
LDSQARMVGAAKRTVVEHGWTNVRIVNADAARSGLPPAAFEFFHERLVLINHTRIGCR